jgi:hypothetical protein
MDTIELLGSTLGLSFLAGLRLYSTVLVLGLGLRFGWLHAPGGFEQHAAILASPWVLGTASVAFLAEFWADKIPWVDSAWDSFHTLVRPIGAALLGLAAFSSVDPALKVAVAILCGGVALSSHSSKAAARLAINHSPEPVSNAVTSLAEDLLVPFGVWFSMKYPLVVLAFVLVFLAGFVWIAPKVYRRMKRQVTTVKSWITAPDARR